MVYPPVSPTWRLPPLRPIVLLLHAPSQAAVAGELVRVWQSSIPVADIFTVSVVEEGRTDFANLPAALVDGSGACKRALILVGVCGAEDAALRLGFDRRLPRCAGVLAVGRVMPPLGPLAVQMPDQVGRQRIWEVSDATNWAVALGELLSWYRAAGLDAQGGVLEPVDNTQADACGFSPALVRMGRVYLAELVAIAMGGQPQPPVTQTFRLRQQVGAFGSDAGAPAQFECL
jgi:hypothetical protein